MLSLMAMAFRLVQAAVLGLTLLNLQRAVALLSQDGFDIPQRDALISSLLQAHGVGYDIGLFFFGINCLLVGVLLYRAPLVPRVLGGLVGISGLRYVQCLQ